VILRFESFSGYGVCVKVGFCVSVKVGGEVGVLLGSAVGEAVNVSVGVGVNVALGVKVAFMRFEGANEMIFNGDVADEIVGVPNQRKETIVTKVRRRNHGIAAVRLLVSDLMEILLGISCRL
jgi:hypothetical protein